MRSYPRITLESRQGPLRADVVDTEEGVPTLRLLSGRVLTPALCASEGIRIGRATEATAQRLMSAGYKGGRSVNARQRARKRKQENVAAAQKKAEAIEITVRELPANKVLAAAIRAYNDHQSAVYWDSDGRYGGMSANVHSPPDFLERIQVNYLRHGQTLYDDHLLAALADSYRQIGAADMRQVFHDTLKRRALVAIAAAYPHLADECARQAPTR